MSSLIVQQLNPEAEGDEIGLLDLVVVVAENLKLLIIGPLVGGLVALGVAFLLPKSYTSQAYLSLSGDNGPMAEQLIKSPAVIGKVVAEHPSPNVATGEAALREFLSRITWQDMGKDSSLYMLGVDDRNPAQAQLLNNALVETWLKETKPRPEAFKVISQQLELTEGQITSTTQLINRLNRETPQLVIPGMQNELASSLAELETQRNDLITKRTDLQRQLEGFSRDVVVVAPTLPIEPSFPRKGQVAVYSAIGTGILLILFVLVRAAFNVSTADPIAAAKIARIRNSLSWRRRDGPTA